MPPDPITLDDLKEAAQQWDERHQVVDFTTDEIDPENKIFCGLPYDRVGTVSSALGMPAKFAGELPHDLLKRNLAHLVEKTELLKKGRAVITKSGITAVVFNKGDTVIPALQVVESMESALVKARYPWLVDCHSLGPENDSPLFWINVVQTDEFAVDAEDDLKPLSDPKVGDALKGGFSLLHDISGVDNTKVETLVYRLVCANGMIAEERGSKWSVRHEDLEDKLAGRLEYLSTFTTKVMTRFTHAQHTALSDPLQSAASLVMELKLPKAAREALYEELEDSLPETYYDLINAVTASANGLGSDLKRKVQMKVGALVATLPEVCDNCHQVIH